MTLPVEELASFVAVGDTLVLATVSSATERALLRDWLADQRALDPACQVEVIPLAPGQPPSSLVEELAKRLVGDDARPVVAVRVFWIPETTLSNRSKILGLLAGRDPYRPSERRQRRTMRVDPSRARLVAGRPASVGELRELWRDTTAGGGPDDFARFVLRRAILSIERIEYRLLGPEYKSPRLVKPEMLASARFRAGLSQIPGGDLDQAGTILDEMATGWSRLSVDLIPAMSRFIYRRGFEPRIDYVADEIEAMRAGLENHPAVLLFSHRSNLDAFVLSLALQENRLPRAHIIGGINMSFGLMGPIMRRSGVVFIRRNIGDNALYKYVLKEYVGYLVAKRFNLTWSLEGSRSRTGKMLPPKLGLMSYVADAFIEGRTDDILLQPVSISFDQLHETTEYAAYARGGEKAPEGLRWFYGFIKAQGDRHYGKIYVRFPEAVSMRRHLGPLADAPTVDRPAKRLAMQKMAMEVAWRILRATPVNAVSLVSTVLVANRGVALTLPQLHADLQHMLDHLERTKAAVSESAGRLRSLEGVRAAADLMSNGHPVTRFDGGYEPVWRVAPEHEHEAAFYRNSLIHAFLETSIVELALAYAARQPESRLDAFWSQAVRLRDVLKFDFYFADTAAFRQHLADELARCDDDWELIIDRTDDGAVNLLRHRVPLVAHALLRPFFEAYQIVADVLCGSPAEIDDKTLIARALGVGRQYAAQNRVRGTESASALLFATARQVMEDQGLLTAAPELPVQRAAFLSELTNILGDLDEIEDVWRHRRSAHVADRRPVTP